MKGRSQGSGSGYGLGRLRSAERVAYTPERVAYTQTGLEPKRFEEAVGERVESFRVRVRLEPMLHALSASVQITHRRLRTVSVGRPT